MDLLSANDWNSFRSAIKDLRDTFFKFPIIYIQRRTRTLSKFHEDRSEDLEAVEYPLSALQVPENKDDTDSEITISKSGAVDNSMGVLYFYYDDLLMHNPPLIVGGEPVFVANKDSFKLDSGEEVTIMGVNLVGPTSGPSVANYQLIKVRYKKDLK